MIYKDLSCRWSKLIPHHYIDVNWERSARAMKAQVKSVNEISDLGPQARLPVSWILNHTLGTRVSGACNLTWWRHDKRVGLKNRNEC